MSVAAEDELLYHIDAYQRYNYRKRPSMPYINPLPRQISKTTPKFTDNLPDIDTRFHYNRTVDFLQPRTDDKWISKLPKFTLELLQSCCDAYEYETEFGAVAKRNLPSYYYEASSTTKQRTLRERRGDSARLLRHRLPSARTSPALMTRRAFAHPSNNVAIHFPDEQTSVTPIYIPTSPNEG